MAYVIAEPCIGTKDTACVDACPVSAIFTMDDLPEKWKQYAEINANYVQGGKFTPNEYAQHAPT